MSELVLVDAGVVLGAYDFTGVSNALAATRAADMVAAPRFGNRVAYKLAGLTSGQFEHAGYFDGGDVKDAELFASVGLGDVPMSVCGTSHFADGDPAFFAEVASASYSPGGSVGDMFGFSISGETSGQEWVKGIVGRFSTETATGNGPTFQLGPVGAGQALHAASHVLAMSSSGGELLDLKLERAADSGMTAPTSVVLPTFNARGSQWTKDETETTDEFYRVVWTIGGTAPVIEFLVTIGIR